MSYLDMTLKMIAYLFLSNVASLTPNNSLAAIFLYLHFCLTTGLEHWHSDHSNQTNRVKIANNHFNKFMSVLHGLSFSTTLFMSVLHGLSFSTTLRISAKITTS